MTTATKRTFGAYTVTITHPDKLLFPHITKGDLIDYYQTVAPGMIPYLKDRPLMMERFPDGIYGESFYQKDASSYFPSWIQQALVPKEGGYNNYVVCQNKATLVYLANQACITLHVWLSKIDKLHYPDQLIFDLDPGTHDFKQVTRVALMLKELLEYMGLHPFVMTTGAHGAHVRVPLDRSLEFEEVKSFASQCAQLMVKKDPENITLEIRKEKRQHRLFIDILRNQFGATAVAPYGVRPYETAPVATPLFWHELTDTKLTSRTYTITNLFDRLQTMGNPWKLFHRSVRSLKRAQSVVISMLNA
jgi:bifunctional non-homologous end joining protein LigD